MVRRLPVLKKKTSPSKFVLGQSSHETEVFDILDKVYDGKMRIEAALNEMSILHRKEPEDKLIANEFANLLYQTRQFEKAAEVYSELYYSSPKEPVHRIDLAKSQAMKGDVESARATLNDAIRDLGHQSELDLALVELDLLEKDFEKAGARLDMITREYPDDVHGLFLYAYTAFRMDKLDIAETTFEKLLEISSGDEEVAMWYSRYAIMTGKQEKALQIWDSFDDGIDSFVEIMSRIELMVSMGDTSQIMKLLCKIGDYKPRFIEDHLMFGKAFFYAEEFPSAQKEFDTVLRFEPQNAEALGMSALTSLMRNKTAQFASLWQRTVYLDSLYAVLPMMILKDCMKYIPREKLKNETKKLLNISTLAEADYSRLKRLLGYL
jgi:tetratricopeptide (TPR) repeat protein